MRRRRDESWLAPLTRSPTLYSQRLSRSLPLVRGYSGWIPYSVIPIISSFLTRIRRYQHGVSLPILHSFGS